MDTPPPPQPPYCIGGCGDGVSRPGIIRMLNNWTKDWI